MEVMWRCGDAKINITLKAIILKKRKERIEK